MTPHGNQVKVVLADRVSGTRVPSPHCTPSRANHFPYDPWARVESLGPRFDRSVPTYIQDNASKCLVQNHLESPYCTPSSINHIPYDLWARNQVIGRWVDRLVLAYIQENTSKSIAQNHLGTRITICMGWSGPTQYWHMIIIITRDSKVVHPHCKTFE